MDYVQKHCISQTFLWSTPFKMFLKYPKYLKFSYHSFFYPCSTLFKRFNCNWMFGRINRQWTSFSTYHCAHECKYNNSDILVVFTCPQTSHTYHQLTITGHPHVLETYFTFLDMSLIMKMILRAFALSTPLCGYLISFHLNFCQTCSNLPHCYGL